MLLTTKSGLLIQDISFPVVLPVILTVIFYSLYWLIASSGRLKERLFRSFEPDTAGILYVVAKRLIGFILLGVVPLTVCLLFIDGYSLPDAGLGFKPEKSGFTVLSIVLMSLLIIPVISNSARRPSIHSVYPEIRVSLWTRDLMVLESVTWALYLLGYETLFRGVLLFGLVQPLGTVIAIAVNVVLYSAAHIPKGKSEALAAIPFGIVLCILTLISGSVWIAFLAHLVNAVSLSIAAIKHNPDMSYVRSVK